MPQFCSSYHRLPDRSLGFHPKRVLCEPPASLFPWALLGCLSPSAWASPHDGALAREVALSGECPPSPLGHPVGRHSDQAAAELPAGGRECTSVLAGVPPGHHCSNREYPLEARPGSSASSGQTRGSSCHSLALHSVSGAVSWNGCEHVSCPTGTGELWAGVGGSKAVRQAVMGGMRGLTEATQEASLNEMRCNGILGLSLSPQNSLVS